MLGPVLNSNQRSAQGVCGTRPLSAAFRWIRQVSESDSHSNLPQCSVDYSASDEKGGRAHETFRPYLVLVEESSPITRRRPDVEHVGKALISLSVSLAMTCVETEWSALKTAFPFNNISVSIPGPRRRIVNKSLVGSSNTSMLTGNSSSGHLEVSRAFRHGEKSGCFERLMRRLHLVCELALSGRPSCWEPLETSWGVIVILTSILIKWSHDPNAPESNSYTCTTLKCNWLTNPRLTIDLPRRRNFEHIVCGSDSSWVSVMGASRRPSRCHVVSRAFARRACPVAGSPSHPSD